MPNEVISVTLSEDPDNPLPAGVSIDTSANSFTYTLFDSDPTVVTLARVGSGAVSEGGTVEFTVTLGRALIAGEIIDVPLSVGGTGVTTSDWSLARKTGTSLNTGVTLSGTSTSTPTVRFSGAGARTATLVLTPADDGPSEGTETYRIALGSNAAFDASSLGTNVGGGADPHATSNDFSVQVSDAAVAVGAGLVLSRPALTVMGGGTTSYTVRLAAAPTGAVTVGIASDNADVTVSPSSLTFTAGNWENARIVTVSAVADGDGVVDTAVLTHTGSGGGYDGISGTVDVAVSESNGAVPSNCQTGPWYDGRGRNPLHKGCIWLSAPSGAVAEGAAVPFTIHAHPAPTEDIEVDLVVFDALFRSDADGYFPDYVRGRDEGRKRLVIGTGMSSVTHMVPTVDDAVYDAPGSVRAKIWGGARTVRKHGRPSRETYPYFNRGREQSVEVTNDDSKASAYVSPEVYVSAEHRYQYLNRPGIPGSTVFTPGPVVSAGTAVTRGERAEFCVGVEGGLLDRRVTVTVEALSRATSTDPWTRITGGTIGVGLSYATPGDRRRAEGCVKVDTAGLGGREVAVRAVPAGRVYNLGQNRLNLPYTVGANAIATRPVRAAQAGVSFTTGPRLVREEAGTVDVHVDIVPAPSSELALGFAVAGTATPGADYTIPGLSGRSGTLTVPAGAGRATIPVTIVDDDVEDTGETVVLTLRASGGYGVAAPGSVTLTILNDDPLVDGQVITADTPSGCSARQTVADYLVEVRDNPKNAAVRGHPAHIAKWNRVLEAIGHDTGTGLSPMPDPEIHANAKKWPDSPFKAASDHLNCVEAQGGQDQDQPRQEPEIAVTAGSAVTEGGDAVFTLTATPAPAADLSVSVTVATDGDWGITAGSRTVTIPASGSATLTLATAGDDADEPDGSVSVTVAAGSGYTVGSSGSGTVAVRDDDDPATPAVDPALVAEVRAMAAQTQHGAAHVKRWRRVLVAFGVEEYPGLTPTTLAEAKANAQKYSSPLWPKIVEALEKLEAAPDTPPDTPPLTPPEIAVSAGSAVTEGGDAVFTLMATPAPAADLPVSVTVATDGDWGITAGSRTVTIPASGSATLTLATTGDDADEPDGSVTVTVADGSGYTVGSAGSGTVAVRDDDAALPVVTLAAGAAVTEGGDAVFTLTATPAPAADLPVSVSVAADGDWGVTAGSRTVTIPTTGSATLTLATTDDSADEPDGSVTATVQVGSGYTVGASASGTVAVRDDDLPPPVVTIAAKAGSVTEGGDAVFTLTADRAPDADLTVTLAVSETGDGDHVAAADEGPAALVIPKDATAAAFIVATVNDDADEPDGAAVVTVEAGAGYTVGDPASASVEVKDDDVPSTVPALSVGDSTAKEGGRLPIMPFTVRLAPAAQGPVRVYVSTRPSTPVSAEPGQDYAPGSSDLTFRAGETEKVVWIRIYDDSHDEGSETFEVVLSNARGAAIGDGVAVGTIVNDDPMPAAFLARFGRTVAEQALDGIAGRMAAPRTAGMQGAIAGQAVGFGPAESGIPAAGGVPSADGTADGSAALAMKEVAQAFGGQAGHSGHDAGGFGNGPGHDASGFGASSPEPQSRTMSAREALLGSSFSLTGERDGSGGSMAFWGRAAQGSFDGAEGTFSLDGTVTTGMLGADYARGKWLIGLALAQSDGEGDYRDTKAMPRPPEQICGENRELCDGAVRTGDGKVEASLTAAVPYAAFQASERLKLWGAAGYGTGEVTLKTAMGGRYSADTSWSMAAAGMRGDLLAPPVEGSGPALAVTSDALWARTSSEKTRDLAASDSDATRLRVGLEGSYHVALEDGGSLVPKLEVGARHDGGDAETGFGVELGGGVKWTDPGLGLMLDLSGRTLIAHGNDDLKDRGFSASFAWDPAPETRRGPTLSLRQAMGGQAQGGLDALFAPDPLADRAGSEADSRWAMEAAYGLPVFGGRWTGSPHAELGLATGARDYSLGWRLAPEAANAPDLSFGLKAARRESDAAETEHVVGIELISRW